MLLLLVAIAWSQDAPTPEAPLATAADITTTPVDVPAEVYPQAPNEPPAPGRFPSATECLTWASTHRTAAERILIRRFDAVHRRCDREADGWVYRETHADLLLDPILDPAYLLGPAIGIPLTRLQRDDVVARGAERWRSPGGSITRPDPPFGLTAPVGRWASFREGWLGTNLALAAILPGLTSSGNNRATDTIVMAETLLVTWAITDGIHIRNPRPRPYTAVDLLHADPAVTADLADDLTSPRAWTSNPADHTALVAASTFGLATLWSVHHRDARPTAFIAPYAAALLSTGLQASADVLSLESDMSDVAIGATIGAATGIFIPLSHAAIARVIDPDRARRSRKRDPRPPGVSVQPTLTPGGAGVVGTW